MRKDLEERLEKVVLANKEMCKGICSCNPLPLENEQSVAEAIIHVKIEGRRLQFIREQTPEICVCAIEQDVNAIQFIDNEEVRQFILELLIPELDLSLNALNTLYRFMKLFPGVDGGFDASEENLTFFNSCDLKSLDRLGFLLAEAQTNLYAFHQERNKNDK